MIKLWHDDIRPAPESWVWARTNLEAQRHLVCGIDAMGAKTDKWVNWISLDHDLGLDHYGVDEIIDNPELIMGKGQSKKTGLELVKWMVGTPWVPERITIHSWNPDGAREMAAVFNDAGHDVTIDPFDMSIYDIWVA